MEQQQNVIEIDNYDISLDMAEIERTENFGDSIKKLMELFSQSREFTSYRISNKIFDKLRLRSKHLDDIWRLFEATSSKWATKSYVIGQLGESPEIYFENLKQLKGLHGFTSLSLIWLRKLLKENLFVLESQCQHL